MSITTPAEYSFDKTNIPANVSGEVKGEVPVTPITVLAPAKATIDLTNNAAEIKWSQVTNTKTANGGTTGESDSCCRATSRAPNTLLRRSPKPSRAMPMVG